METGSLLPKNGRAFSTVQEYQHPGKPSRQTAVVTWGWSRIIWLNILPDKFININERLVHLTRTRIQEREREYDML